MGTPIKGLAIGILFLSLLLTLFAVVTGWSVKEDLFRFTQLLLSWQVLGAWLAAAGAATFQAEIRDRLRRGPPGQA